MFGNEIHYRVAKPLTEFCITITASVVAITTRWCNGGNDSSVSFMKLAFR